MATLAYENWQYLQFLRAFPVSGLTGPEVIAALRDAGMEGTGGGYYVPNGCLMRDPVTDRRFLTAGGLGELVRLTYEVENGG